MKKPLLTCFLMLTVHIIPAQNEYLTSFHKNQTFIPVAHTKAITALAQSADGKWLASASSDDGVVIIWNLESGKIKQRFRLNKEVINQILFSHDNQTLILACNRELVFMNTTSGVIQKVVPFQQPISSFCSSPLDDRLFVATGNPPFFGQPADSTGEFLIYSLTENRVERKFLFLQPIKKVEFVPETNSLVLVFFDWNISLRDYSGNEISKNNFSYSPTAQMGIIPGHTIIIASGNQLQKRNLLSGKVEGSIKIPDLVSVQDMKLGNNRSDIFILSNYPKPNVRKINLAVGETINLCRLASNANVFIPDIKQKTLFVTDGETIRVVDSESLKTIKILGGYNDWITSLNLDLKKKELSVFTGDSLQYTWNLKSGKLTKTTKLPGIELTNTFTLHDNKLKIQLFGSNRDQIIINNTDTYDPVKGIYTKTDTLKAGDGFNFNSAVLSPDEEKLALACSDGSIRLFNLLEKRWMGQLTEHQVGAISVVFLNDSLLFSGSEDHTVKLWSVRNSQPLATLVTVGKKDWMVFTEDGRYDASDATLPLRFWEHVPNTLEKRFTPGLLGKFIKGEITFNHLKSGQISTGLTDIDGNVYKIQIYGEQTWMVENLRVTHLNNGESIPYLPDTLQWPNYKNPSFYWYESDKDGYAPEYGMLYNYYAVNTDKLCPAGWHVPDVADWKNLDLYIRSQGWGDGFNVGKAMASTNRWKPETVENSIGWRPELNNKSGFNGQPTGLIDTDGRVSGRNQYALWWMHRQIGELNMPENVNIYQVDSQLPSVFMLQSASPMHEYEEVDKELGVSVRCVKDK